MIDHTSFTVKNYPESLNFYDLTLKEIGYERIITVDLPDAQAAGYGIRGRPGLWISPLGQNDEDIGKAKGVHVAFVAPSVSAIKRWYQKCLELGGQSNGEPGPRPHYHLGYYGAFIIDPNGWRIEACLHDYQGQMNGSTVQISEMQE